MANGLRQSQLEMWVGLPSESNGLPSYILIASQLAVLLFLQEERYFDLEFFSFELADFFWVRR